MTNPTPAKIPLAGDVNFDAPPDAPKVREIPVWLTGLVVLACIAGGAWFVWTTFLSAGPSERIVILDRGPDDGVKERAGKYDVRSGSAALTITRSGDNDLDMDFKFAKQEYLSAEQIDVLTKVWRLTKDAAMAAEIKVTPEQMLKLQENRAKAKIDLTPEDKAKLKTLFVAYDAQKDDKAKRAAETKLLKALDVIGSKLEGPAKASAAERTEQAKSILTPEQMKHFDEIGKGDGAPAGPGNRKG